MAVGDEHDREDWIGCESVAGASIESDRSHTLRRIGFGSDEEEGRAFQSFASEPLFFGRTRLEKRLLTSISGSTKGRKTFPPFVSLRGLQCLESLAASYVLRVALALDGGQPKKTESRD